MLLGLIVVSVAMGLLDVLPQVGTLLLFTLVFLVIAVWRFRFE